MGYQNIFSSEGGRVLTLSFFSGHPGMGWVFVQIFFSGYLLIDRLKYYYGVSKYLLIRRGEGAHFELLLSSVGGRVLTLSFFSGHPDGLGILSELLLWVFSHPQIKGLLWGIKISSHQKGGRCSL